MATVWTSNHFRGDVWKELGVTEDSDIVLAGAQATMDLDKTHMALAGLHGRARIAMAKMEVGTIGGTSGDIVRCFSLPSNSRVYTMRILSMGESTNYVADLGVYLSGKNHDGAVVDSNLYGAATPSTAIDSVTNSFAKDVFTAGALNDENRGDPLWHQCGVGGGSDVVDPVVNYDICLTSTTTLITDTAKVMLFCEYTAGG